MRGASARKIGLLSALYFAEGLPFGFQATLLPALLRAHGVSLESVGYAGALSLPWVLKPLWAPFVDRHRSKRFGARRGWIVPLELLLALCCLGAAFVDPTEVGLLLALVFFMNLFAATADIAIDGLAIDLLEPDELGGGNAVQVVGYKAGMLTGGGLLGFLTSGLGTRGLFLAMGGLVLVVAVIALFAKEPEHTKTLPAPASIGEIARRLRDLLVLRHSWLLVLFVGTYKVGETMIDTMLKPYLVDHGFTVEQIALWIGTYGMVASISGSLAGGWLATKRSLLSAVGLSAGLRILPMFALVVMALAAPTQESVIAITCAEHFFAGALTTATFAFMMSLVDKEIGATHYAVLASLEVLGKSAGGLLSGRLAQEHGYPALFVIGTALSLVFLFILAKLRESLEEEPGALAKELAIKPPSGP